MGTSRTMQLRPHSSFFNVAAMCNYYEMVRRWQQLPPDQKDPKEVKMFKKEQADLFVGSHQGTYLHL